MQKFIIHSLLSSITHNKWIHHVFHLVQNNYCWTKFIVCWYEVACSYEMLMLLHNCHMILLWTSQGWNCITQIINVSAAVIKTRWNNVLEEWAMLIIESNTNHSRLFHWKDSIQILSLCKTSNITWNWSDFSYIVIELLWNYFILFSLQLTQFTVCI